MKSKISCSREEKWFRSTYFVTYETPSDHFPNKRITSLIRLLQQPQQWGCLFSTHPLQQALTAPSLESDNEGVWLCGVCNTARSHLQPMKTQGRASLAILCRFLIFHHHSLLPLHIPWGDQFHIQSSLGSSSREMCMICAWH